MSDFDPTKASTWDDNQKAVYETGHREGESCRSADWFFAFDELLPADVDGFDPWAVAEWVKRLHAALTEIANDTDAYSPLALQAQAALEQLASHS